MALFAELKVAQHQFGAGIDQGAVAAANAGLPPIGQIVFTHEDPEPGSQLQEGGSLFRTIDSLAPDQGEVLIQQALQQVRGQGLLGTAGIVENHRHPGRLAGDLLEKCRSLGVGQSQPEGKSHLYSAGSDLLSKPGPANDLGRPESGASDLGGGSERPALLHRDPGHLPPLVRRLGVELSCGSVGIYPMGAGPARPPHVLPQGILVHLVLGGPGNRHPGPHSFQGVTGQGHRQLLFLR